MSTSAQMTSRGRHSLGPPAGDPIETLLYRARLTGLTETSRDMLRVAGLPLLLTAVVAGPGGWSDASATILPHPADKADPSGRTTARRRAHAAGLHPVDTNGGPVPTYRVRAGDTVSEIAERTGTSVRAVLAANGLGPDGFIRTGQVLTLPALPRPSATTAARNGHTQARPVVHIVRRGDTAWEIAHRYGVSLAALLRANGLTTRSLIRPGRKLILPGRRSLVPTPAATSRTRTTARQPRRTTPLDATFLGRTYPPAVLRAAALNRETLAHRSVPTKAEVRTLVGRTATRYGVDPALALAVATVESGFQQRAVSPANAVGTMQITPAAGAWASELAGRRLDLLDAEDNVTAGVVLLAALLARVDTPTAIAGYYQGLASVRRHGMYPDTRRYVATVRTIAARLR